MPRRTPATRSSLPASPRFLVLLVVAAFSWGAVVKAALADHYHVACVAHGFVHGDNTNDGSFFSRVDAGCGSTYRRCALYVFGSYAGEQTVGNSSATCNYWSRSAGNFSECGSTAHTSSSGVFGNHVHKAHNYCG